PHSGNPREPRVELEAAGRQKARANLRMGSGSLKTAPPIFPQQPSLLCPESFPNRSSIILALLMGRTHFNPLITPRFPPLQTAKSTIRLVKELNDNDIQTFLHLATKRWPVFNNAQRRTKAIITRF